MFAAKDAVSVRTPEVCGVKITEHEETPGVAPACSVQPFMASEAPVEARVIAPEGVAFVPSACVSVTMMVSVAGWPTIATAESMLSVVEVLRVFTVRDALPELAA